MDTYAFWAPQVTHDFWEAVQRKDLFAAARIVERYENPYFEHTGPHPKGYAPAQQAAYEIFGRGPRWMRPPQPSLNDTEVEELRAVFEKMGLL
jgi:dihydrodipicolinate synthase/N-acetylneuraminate lyase